MNEEKINNEGEMGSGDSDDEFYNVKLPCTPSDASDKSSKKLEVKKVYSPSRTKVKYDYKFDSSSDDEKDNEDLKKNSEDKTKSDSSGEDKLTDKNNEPSKSDSSLSPSGPAGAEKINEEFKSVKNSNVKMCDKGENTGTNQSIITTSISSPVNVSRPQIGVVPPVVVVPPIVVPQTPVMNMAPMLVSSSVGVGGQNILSGHMMGMPGNMLRGPAPIGGIMTNSGNPITNNMIGMNAMPGQIAGLINMQGNIVSLPGSTMAGQGNVMGLQAGIINPAVGGMNMSMQGNMMRMAAAAAAGNSMLHMSRPSVVGVQNANSLLGISRQNNNLIGMTRPIGVAGPTSSIIGMQNAGNGVITNSGSMVVNPGNVLTNPLVGNPGSLVVMGGVMNTMAPSNLVCTTQTNMLANPGGIMGSNNMLRMMTSSPTSSGVRPVPPPPFLNIRNRPPAPNNLKWQANSLNAGNLSTTGSSSTSVPVTSYNNTSPASSPVDRFNAQVDGDEVSRDEKEISLSDRSSNLETDESQSPPREIPNTFKNDGSFMEMFKKMKDEKNKEAASKFFKLWLSCMCIFTKPFGQIILSVFLFLKGIN